MMEITLSDRLEAVVSFVSAGSRAADIGTDHGYVPIALLQRGIAVRAFAMDVREGPLARARENISQCGLDGQIETRLSDGVAALEPGEADTVIVAGMGGERIIRILRDGRRLWDTAAHWILSPQSEADRVRVYLQENGFTLSREKMICEDGKFYLVMDAVRGEMGLLDPEETLYGPCLIRAKDPVLSDYLQREECVLGRILGTLTGQAGEHALIRREELTRRLACARQAEARIRRGGAEIHPQKKM